MKRLATVAVTALLLVIATPSPTEAITPATTIYRYENNLRIDNNLAGLRRTKSLTTRAQNRCLGWLSTGIRPAGRRLIATQTAYTDPFWMFETLSHDREARPKLLDHAWHRVGTATCGPADRQLWVYLFRE
jgi:hypothetical protein